MIPGKKINLWAIERGDLLQSYLWANDPEMIKLTGMDPSPKSAWEMEQWYESILRNPNTRTLAVKLNDGTYIGNTEISSIDWRCGKGEIGIMIADRKNRRKGYAREAVLLTCRFGFEELGLHRIYARVLPFNQPALKLFESCNFVREGEERESFFTWGRWWSPVCFSVLAQEFFKKFPDETAQE